MASIKKDRRSAGLYLKNGYLNYKTIIDRGCPFTVIVGGRGIGKSYGILQYCIKNKIKFIYMRRSQSMVDQLSTNALNPIKTVCDDMGIFCDIKKSGKYIAVMRVSDGEITDDHAVGIMVALSTFANLRGFDAADYKVLIFDEFIPQENEKRMKGEGVGFLNAIETIARNRELIGSAPLQVYLLTNSNTLNSEILLSLNLFDSLIRLQDSTNEILLDPSRGLQVIRPHSIISEKKKDTALYKFAGESDFSEMAIDNTFDMPDAVIGSVDLAGLRPVAVILDYNLCIYKKGKKYYVTDHISGAPKEFYKFDKKGLMRFMRVNVDFLRAIEEKRVSFQNLKFFYQLTGALGLL